MRLSDNTEEQRYVVDKTRSKMRHLNLDSQFHSQGRSGNQTAFPATAVIGNQGNGIFEGSEDDEDSAAVCDPFYGAISNQKDAIPQPSKLSIARGISLSFDGLHF